MHTDHDFETNFYSNAHERRVAAIEANLRVVRAAIAEHGGPADITIVGVSKGQPLEAIVAAADAGIGLFGENYADELVAKATDPRVAARQLNWTYQGRLQTNKINRLVPHVSLWQTIDSAERAQALAKRRPGATVLLQINLTNAAGRTGVDATDSNGIHALVGELRTLPLDLVGVMGVGPDPGLPGATDVASLAAFRSAIEVADRYDLPIRSLGMSADYLLAVRAGATMIRIGSLLFGARA